MAQLKAFHYDMVIEAENQQQADRVMIERVGFDEDLSEYGVVDYTVDANPVGGRELDPIEVGPDVQDAPGDPEGPEEPQGATLAPAIDAQGPVTSVNGEQYFSVIRINRALGGTYVLPSAERVYVFEERKYVLEFSYQLPDGSLRVRLDEEGALYSADVERDGELVALTEGPLHELIVAALNVSAEE